MPLPGGQHILQKNVSNGNFYSTHPSYLYRMNENQLYTLFVYGSLRQGFKSEAYQYISRYFTLVDAAKVKGRLYDMGSYPAGVSTGDDVFIAGELYQIKSEAEFGWAMAQIDDYEGLNVEAGETPLYRRDIARAILSDGSAVDSWVYWYDGPLGDRPVIESGDVLEYLRTKQG
jgi:gamma-glutamylcyclotransferase (GGCT)/AIG2-like uncharacterized protein YtfP